MPTPTIACEKCHQGTMAATRLARMSPGLVLLGRLLWIPAAALLAGAVLMTCVVGQAGSSVTSESVSREKTQAVTDLRGISPAVADEFEQSNRVSAATLEGLTADQRARVDRVTSTYNAAIAGVALGGATATGIAGLGALAAFVACAPFLIVGFLLTLKKNVWKCPSCGYVFDRA